MEDPFAALQAALAGRYAIEHELGQGGMATVYLARDIKHDRHVALKVLRPELSAVLGVSAERFLREIRITAKLDHPHIPTLIDSDSDQGQLWYALEYIRGESLRKKLRREVQLAVDEALTITTQVASALDYAHRQEVIHRDIKPENILLHEGEAMLSDFGIALAVREAGGDRLSQTGIALGTPQYMSPEQASGSRDIDARSDVYSLAVVLYEMLTGTPPHTGATAQAILAKVQTERPTPIRTVRDTVPEGMDAAVMKALAKVPIDRFASATEFRDALGAAIAPVAPQNAIAPVAPRKKTRAVRIAIFAGGLVAVVAAAVWLLRPRVTTPLDPNLVAVAPFRTGGADSSLVYLREGMVDLLAAKLTGEGGLRAADPRSTISAWRHTGGSEDADVPEEAALRLAARIGAGKLLLGGVVGTRTHVALNATLLTVPTSRSGAQVSVEGSPDSLPTLVDRLAAQLLARSSGVEENRVRSLTATTTSLEALRAYLDGESEYRHGHYRQAALSLGLALQIDSTFALAAFALAQAAGWGLAQFDEQRAERLAWALRGRLSARDQTLLSAMLGPRYPRSSQAEVLAARERAVEVVPEQAEAWYFLGDQYYHFGAYLGFIDATERATVAFRRALAIDSTFAGPMFHLAHLRALAGDTADLKRLATLYLRLDSTEYVQVRWDMSVFLRDPHLLAEVRSRLDSGTLAATDILLLGQVDDVGLEDFDRAVFSVRHAATTDDQRRFADALAMVLAFNRGRPHEADSLLALVFTGGALDYARIAAALYWDGDTSLAAQAAQRHGREVDGPLSASPKLRASQYDAICMLEQWRLWNGMLGSASQTIARLKSAVLPRDSTSAAERAAVCAALLDAVYTVRRRATDARMVTQRFDSVMRTGPAATDGLENLVLARLWAEQRDPVRALAAARRREYHITLTSLVALTSYLREQGRLAAATGNRQGAIRAYQHYLDLRSHPEPSLKPQVDQVRAELSKLLGEPVH